ncbi:MAG: hypothetical protein IJ424_08640 [Oscillospiraceae bacterium]|nr:hypothetical protein [Oscillospiraceae bacterium]
MRKLIAIILTAVLALALSACASSEPKLRAYVYETEEDELMPPTVTLLEDNRFMFVFSPISSYIGFGTYAINEDVLTLTTDDGEYVYIFEIANGKLVFNAEDSSEMTWFAEIPDGAEFN